MLAESDARALWFHSSIFQLKAVKGSDGVERTEMVQVPAVS
jgi:hypothetical protein